MLGILSQRGHLCGFPIWYAPSQVLSHRPGPQPLLAWSFRHPSVHPSLHRHIPGIPAIGPAGAQCRGPTHIQILSHQACPRAAVPRASRAPNATSRCVQGTALTTAPARSTRATSPSADVYLASWVTVASTVSIHPNPPGKEEGSRHPKGQVERIEAVCRGTKPRLWVLPAMLAHLPGIGIVQQKECPV